MECRLYVPVGVLKGKKKDQRVLRGSGIRKCAKPEEGEEQEEETPNLLLFLPSASRLPWAPLVLAEPQWEPDGKAVYHGQQNGSGGERTLEAQTTRKGRQGNF